VVVRPARDYTEHPYSIAAGARVLVVVNGAQATVTLAYR
jgi:hypothetical protein